jgi:hypothetical protein
MCGTANWWLWQNYGPRPGVSEGEAQVGLLQPSSQIAD